MSDLSRRTVLGATVIGLASYAAMPRSAHAVTAARALRTTGTTLETAAAPAGTSGYRRLSAGPGWPVVVREDLCPAKAGRDDRRTGAAAFAQVTDLHMLDAQSPVRVEWLHDVTGSAFRPQEALGAQGGVSIIRQTATMPWGVAVSASAAMTSGSA